MFLIIFYGYLFTLYVFTGCCVENRHFLDCVTKTKKYVVKNIIFTPKFVFFSFTTKSTIFSWNNFCGHICTNIFYNIFYISQKIKVAWDKTILLDLSLFTLSYRKLASIISTCTTREHYTRFSGKDACARYCHGAEIRDQRNNIFANFLFRRYDKIVRSEEHTSELQ